MEWEKLTYNEILKLDGDNFISYNAAPPIGNEGPETALVVKGKEGEKTRYLILMGDWRKRYEEAYEKDGFGGCLRLFTENQAASEGSWSDGLPGESPKMLRGLFDKE